MMFHSDFLPQRFVYQHKRPDEVSKRPGEARPTVARPKLEELRRKIEESRGPEQSIPGVNYPPPVEKLEEEPISLDRAKDGDKELVIIKELQAIKAREFDNKIIGRKYNLENFQRYNKMIENSPNDMAYEAILANKSKGQLIKEFTSTMEGLRNKVLDQSLLKETWVAMKTAWNLLTEDTGKTLGGLHKDIQKRIEGKTQLIHPQLALTLYADLQELNYALFTAPLKDADNDAIDEDQREFIEEVILPNLAKKIVNESIVENFPIGEEVPPETVGTPIYTPDYRLKNKVTKTVQKKTPREFAFRDIAQTYASILVDLRESCFKPDQKPKRTKKREKAKRDANITKGDGFTRKEIQNALLVEEQQAVNDWL